MELFTQLSTPELEKLEHTAHAAARKFFDAAAEVSTHAEKFAVSMAAGREQKELHSEICAALRVRNQHLLDAYRAAGLTPALTDLDRAVLAGPQAVEDFYMNEAVRNEEGNQ